MNKNICIYGTGGFAREVLTLITDLGKYDDVKAFLEPDNIWKEKFDGKMIMGVPVLPESTLNAKESVVTIAIGDSKIREKVCNSLPLDTEFITLIHPNVIMSHWVEVGEGAIICAGSILTSQIKIGKHAQLNLQTTIGHDCVIGDFFTTAPSVNISGACNFGNHVYFGTGAATRQGVNITSNVVIGMGAMAVKNIEESGVYVGIPAKKIK